MCFGLLWCNALNVYVNCLSYVIMKRTGRSICDKLLELCEPVSGWQCVRNTQDVGGVALS